MRGGSRGKYLGARQHRPKLPNQPPQPSKNAPLCNYLQVLLLHTAAVTKDLDGQGSGLGGTPPCPNVKLHLLYIHNGSCIWFFFIFSSHCQVYYFSPHCRIGGDPWQLGFILLRNYHHRQFDMEMHEAVWGPADLHKGCWPHIALHTRSAAYCLINFMGNFHTPRICNFVNLLISWVHSFTELYLSDTDSIVPFENTTPVNMIHLLCVILFSHFYYD